MTLPAEDYGFEPESAGPAEPSVTPEATPRAPQVDDLGFEPEEGAPPTGSAPPPTESADQGLPGQAIRWLAEHDKTSPERRADVIRYTAASGLPLAAVEAGLDDVKARVDASGVDWEEVARRQPALAGYLKSRPHAIALIKQPDEIDALHGVEWGVTGHWEKLPKQVGAALHKAGDAFGGVTGFALHSAARAADWFGYVPTVFPSWAAQVTRSFADLQEAGITAADTVGLATDADRNYVLRQKLEMPEHNYAKAVGEDWSPARMAATAFLLPARVGPMMAGQAGITAMGGVLGPVGAVLGGAGYFGALNLGQAHEAIVAATPDQKPTVGTRALAVGASAIGGLALELGPGAISKKLFGTLLEDGGAAAIKDILSPAAPLTATKALQALGKTAATYGKDVAFGSAAMGTQAAINAAAVQAEQLASGGKAEWTPVALAFGDNFVSSLGDMALLAALPAGQGFLRDVGLGRRVASEQLQYATAVAGARESELLKKLPNEFKAVVEKTGSKFYVPVEEWATYFQSKKLDPEKMAGDVVGDGGAAFREAAATGGDIAIPAGDFLAKLANTEHAEGLAEDVKLSRDSQTPKQRARDLEVTQKRLEEQAKLRSSELAEGKRAVEDFVRKQATSANFAEDEAKAVAKQFSEYAGTMALRLGVSVREAAARGSLDQLRILGPRGEAVANRLKAEFSAFLHPEAAQYLDQRLGSISPETQGRELYIDSNTGLQNELAFAETKTPEGQSVGRISVSHIKAINDEKAAGGHEKGNELYRLVGKALHDVAPGASFKVGGDFAVHVKDEAALKEIVDRVQGAIPDKRIKVLGELGANFDKLDEKLKATKDALRAKGEYPERKAPFPGNVADLSFPSERANAEVAPHLMEGVRGMTREQYFRKAYLDPETGLLSNLAYNLLPKKAHTIAFDVKDLGAVNDALGRPVGDRMLKAFGRWASHMGGSSFDMAHRSGDEYVAQSNDPEALAAFAERLRNRVRKVQIPVTLEDGRPDHLNIDFRHGIGADYVEADRKLNAARAAEGGLGEGEVQGNVDPGVPEEPRSEEVPRGSGGARPQDFPGRRGTGYQAPGVAVAHFEGAPVTLEQAPHTQEPGPLWYSAADRAVTAAKQAKGTPDSWLAVISKTPGVKKEELEVTGLSDWLKEQKGTVTREQVQEFLREHQIEVSENVLGEGMNSRARDDFERKLSGYGIEVDYSGDEPMAHMSVEDRNPIEIDDRGALRRYVKDEGLLNHSDAERLDKILADLDHFSAKMTEATRYNLISEAQDLAPGIQIEANEDGASFTFPGEDRESRLLTGYDEIVSHMRHSEDFTRQEADNVGSWIASLEHAPTTDAQYEDYALGGHKEGSYRELLFSVPQSADFEAPHFGSEGRGLLAHARISEHKTNDGKPLLLVEEIQSDLHQKGRESTYIDRKKFRQSLRIEHVESEGERGPHYAVYDPDTGKRLMAVFPETGMNREKTLQPEDDVRGRVARVLLNEKFASEEAVPDAPFKANWEEMVAKRLVRWAAEHGYEKLAWTTGEQQAERYSLDKKVQQILYKKNDDGTFRVSAQTHERGGTMLGTAIAAEKLDGMVGREVADKIRALSGEETNLGGVGSASQPKDLWFSLKGLDLKVGGEGMRFAYDKKLPGIFEKLVKKDGGKIQKEGIDGMPADVLRENPDSAVWTVTLPESLRERVVREGMPLFQEPRGTGKPRGSIAVNVQGGKLVNADILNAMGGDKSTLAHESSHFLSWSLHNIATSDLATPQIKDDYQSLIEFAGYKSPEDRAANQSSAKEERISNAWEQYLAEGKAPSRALDRVFARFASWMRALYQGVTGFQGHYERTYGELLKLSDDVRGIFDRMLASDDAIKEARGERGADVEIPDATRAMSPEQRAEYDQLRERAQTASADEINKRAAQILDESVGPERERLSQEVAAELDQKPEYRAMRFLQDGQLATEDGTVVHGKYLPDFLRSSTGEPLKLRRDLFVKQFGKDVASTMPAGIFARGKKNAVDIKALAPLLGFSPDEMVQAFTKAEPRDTALAKETQRRLDEHYGPALQRIRDAAMDASHTEDDLRANLLVYRALAEQVDPAAARRVQNMDRAALKRNAADIIEAKTVGDLDPGQHARAERKTAIRAAELWGAGKKREALAQLEARLLNQILYSTARDAADAMDSGLARLERWSQATGDLGKADPAYRDAHGAILAAIGIDGGKPDAAAFEAGVQRAQADGQALDFDLDGIRQLLREPKDWKDLTVADARNVLDAVTNIRHVAEGTLAVHLEGKRQDREVWFQRFQERASQARPALSPEPISAAARSIGDKLRHKGRGAAAILEDVETWAQKLDGGTEGPVHELLIDARRNCRAKDVELTKRVLEPIKKLFDSIPKAIKKLRDQRVDVADLLPVPPGAEGRFAPVYTRGELYTLFLNWGNEGNRQRIRDGNGWKDANVEKALNMLTKPEADFLQGILDAAQSLKPDLDAVHEKRTGNKLGNVEATPIRIAAGEYRGGYWHLKYDSRFARQGEMQEANTVAAISAPNIVRATVYNSATKARVERVTKAPVDLSWGVIPAHFSQVIHDIAYGDWVREAGGIMLDNRFKNTVKTYLGNERSEVMIPWLKDVANARVDSTAASQASFLKELGPAAKSLVAQHAILLNIPAHFRHMADPLTAAADVEGISRARIASAYLTVMNPANWNLPEFAGSAEIAYREAHHKDNLRRDFGKFAEGSSSVLSTVLTPVRAAAEVGQVVTHFVDGLTSRITFKAAFDQFRAEGMSLAEATQRADAVVSRSIPSGDIAEKPALQRTKQGGFATAVMFYSYANKLYNLHAQSFDAAYRAWNAPDATPGDRVGAVANVAGKWIWLGVAGALGSFLAGRGWRKDDNDRRKSEHPAEWAAKEVLLEPLDTAPLAGPALKAVLTGGKVNVAAAPEVALMMQWFERAQQHMESKASGEKSHDSKIWTAAEALASAMGPLGQAHRTFNYANKVSTHKVRPRGPLDVAGGIFYGKRKNQPANPFTAVQDIISGGR